MPDAFQPLTVSAGGVVTVDTWNTNWREDRTESNPLSWQEGDDQERAGRPQLYRLSGSGDSFSVSQILGGADGAIIKFRPNGTGKTIRFVHVPNQLIIPEENDIVITYEFKIVTFVNKGDGVYVAETY